MPNRDPTLPRSHSTPGPAPDCFRDATDLSVEQGDNGLPVQSLAPPSTIIGPGIPQDGGQPPDSPQTGNPDGWVDGWLAPISRGVVNAITKHLHVI